MQNFNQLEEKKMWNFFSGTLKLKIPHKFFSRLHLKSFIRTKIIIILNFNYLSCNI